MKRHKDWDEEESQKRPYAEPKDNLDKHRNAIYDLIHSDDGEDVDDYIDEDDNHPR